MNDFVTDLRKLAPFVMVGIAVSGLFVLSHWCGIISVTSSLQSLNRSSFLMAGFIVAAFNLRFKLIDTLVGEHYSSSEMRRIRPFIQACRSRLDWNIYLFLLTSFLMAISSVVNPGSSFSNYFASILWGLFTASVLGYFRIISSFRDLEEGLIDKVQSSKRKAEAEEILRPKSK